MLGLGEGWCPAPQQTLLLRLSRPIPLISLRPQGASRAVAAAMSPIMQLTALAEIACMRVSTYQLDQGLATE